MKKFLSLIFAGVLSVGVLFGVGCRKTEGLGLKVYVPDGAPALSVVGIVGSSNEIDYDINSVKPATINTYVSGEDPQADICILPVNAAVKVLGTGAKYKMLGTVTHGNLYLLKAHGMPDITAQNLSSLVGKTVGVINLANVPGLTLKVILNDNDIAFQELAEGAEGATDKVNLINVSETLASAVTCDYFVVAEPAATTKVNLPNATLTFGGDLQMLYGGENGYPQAVAVAKNTVIEQHPKAVSNFIKGLKDTQEWLLKDGTTAEQIASAVTAISKGDMQPTFKVENLSKTVIANCGIRFESSKDCKQAVIDFIQKLNAVSASTWGTPADDFFYNA